MKKNTNPFIKKAENAHVDMRCEASALRWLAEAECEGGMSVVRVLSADKKALSEERIIPGRPSAPAARKIGRALAITHAKGAAWYGCPPDGWDFGWGAGYVIADSLTPVVPHKDAAENWGAYYAESLVMGYTKQAFDLGVIDETGNRLVQRVASRLQDGIYDAPQPDLVEQTIAASSGSIACARLHGDLWAGNILWDASDSSATGGILIDPMAHGGHAETDLAMLSLFGFPYLDEVLRSYDETSPLAEGWRERMQLHQLAPLLHHCVLFGKSYVPAALAVAKAYA